MSVKNKANSIEITRIYDATAEQVWNAWVDPKQVSQWWGPRGFTITTKSKDVKPGGKWIYTMHGPDGTDYPNMTTYYEVEKYKKLVYDHGANESQPAMFKVTVLFEEKKGKTTMSMTMELPSAEAAIETKKIIKQANGNSTWDRLAEFITKQNNDDEVFVINRSFQAPQKTVYGMWTKPEHFTKWLAPTGFDMKIISGSMKVGETLFYSMSGPNNIIMYGKAHYLEMNSPELVMYTQQFSNKEGGLGKHPMAPVWPETMLTKAEFHSEGENQTRITITWKPFGKVTKEELDVFIAARAGMTMGWTGSFDKLENYINESNSAR